jgi:hypothetical protein
MRASSPRRTLRFIREVTASQAIRGPRIGARRSRLAVRQRRATGILGIDVRGHLRCTAIRDHESQLIEAGNGLTSD